CRVDDGSGIDRQIVCGARNYKPGDKVPLALPGAELPNGARIKASKLRGIESEGMLCSARELNLGDDASGLLILTTDVKPGAPLAECPFYSARRIENVRVGPSPDWLRARIESAGIRSINNIVDISNFVMLELGQPTHAFDADKLKGEVEVRLARERETFLALD